MPSICTERSDASPGVNTPPPFISVIVPVRNEAKFIESTLRQLLSQNYPADRFEVVVSDGRSTDTTREIIGRLQREFSGLVLVDNPRQWSSAGRNAAIGASRGDFVVVVDGHCQLDDFSFLQRHAEAFKRSGADCLGRPQPLEISDGTALQKAISIARSSRLGHHPASFIYSTVEQFVPPQSVAVAYRRDVFERVGLFDESFDACEDVELNHRVDRAGMRCLFTPAIQVRYHPRSSLRGLFRQMVRYGRGRVRLARKHPQTLSWAAMAPAVLVFGIGLGWLPALLYPALALTYLSFLTIYAIVVLAATLALACRHRKLSLVLWLPLIYVTLHCGAGCGVLRELIRPLRLARNSSNPQLSPSCP
jgi:succinoglycan biosynthesis protein ExoA